MRSREPCLLVVALLLVSGCLGPVADAPKPATSTTEVPERTDDTATARTESTIATDAANDTPRGSSTDEVTRSSTETAIESPASSETTMDEHRTVDPTTTGPSGRDPSAPGWSRPLAVEGSLPVNATRIYRRVEALLDRSRPAPTVERTEYGAIEMSNRSMRPVRRALGFEANGSLSACGRFYPARAGPERVRLTVGNQSASILELVLAHEFVHVLQQDLPTISGPRKVRHSLSEGSAVYVATAYGRRFDRSWNGATPFEVRRCIYEQVGSAFRPAVGRYYFGARYVRARIDDPSELSEVYRRPPRSMEAILHPDGRVNLTVAALPVAVITKGTWEEHPASGRAGELELRAWLGTELPAERASAAAEGWGNDSRWHFEGGGRHGVAWVLRMDSPGDRAELAGAIEAFAARSPKTLRQVALDERTVVVFAGPPAFLDDATATASDGTVIVSAP